jgi:hypothetical protein
MSRKNQVYQGLKRYTSVKDVSNYAFSTPCPREPPIFILGFFIQEADKYSRITIMLFSGLFFQNSPLIELIILDKEEDADFSGKTFSSCT